MKLKFSEVRPLRDKMLHDNKGICPLCGEKIKGQDAALDHDHKSGHCRNTIHKDCNILLGKIENYINRYGKRFRDGRTLEKFMSNVAQYMQEDYSENHLHPTHKTSEDKKLREWRKRMQRAKRQETKEKYKKLIEEFNNGRKS